MNPARDIDRLVVTTSYPRFPGDPAGCFVESRVRACTDAGETVLILAAGAPAGLDRVMSRPGAAVHRIDFTVAGGPPLFYAGGAPERLESNPAAGFLQALRLWAGLLAAIRAGPRPSAIESHWLVPSALAAICAGPSGVPHQAYAHSGDVALLERLPGGAALARRLLEGASLVFVSAELRARYAELVGERAAEKVAACPIEPASSPLLVAATGRRALLPEDTGAAPGAARSSWPGRDRRRAVATDQGLRSPRCGRSVGCHGRNDRPWCCWATAPSAAGSSGWLASGPSTCAAG